MYLNLENTSASIFFSSVRGSQIYILILKTLYDTQEIHFSSLWSYVFLFCIFKWISSSRVEKQIVDCRNSGMCNRGRQAEGGRMWQRAWHSKPSRSVLNSNVTSQICSYICTVRTMWAGKWLFSSVDYQVTAKAKLVLIALEGFATHRAHGAPFHRSQAQRPSQGWWEDSGSAYTRL